MATEAQMRWTIRQQQQTIARLQSAINQQIADLKAMSAGARSQGWHGPADLYDEQRARLEAAVNNPTQRKRIRAALGEGQE